MYAYYILARGYWRAFTPGKKKRSTNAMALPQGGTAGSVPTDSMVDVATIAHEFLAPSARNLGSRLALCSDL